MKNIITSYPKLRFSNFYADWNRIKLKDIANKVNVKNKDGAVTETFTNSAERGVISQRDYFDKDISNAVNISNYYVVENNDFVYNPRISSLAPVGPINKNNLGRSGVMSPLYYVFRVNNADNNFLSYYFATTKWHKFMITNGDQGARADRFAIGYSTFEKMPILMPEQKEQTQIGNFFQKMDEVIELQQKRLALTQDYKKSMLQKMFPQKGEEVPRVRFGGFSDEWQKNKIQNLTSEAYGGGTPSTKNEDYWNGDIPWIQSSDLLEDQVLTVTPTKKINEDAIKNSATKIVPKGSIAIVSRVGVGKLCLVPYDLTTSQDFLSLVGLKLDPIFSAYMLYLAMQEEKSKVQGTAIKGVTRSDILGKEVLVPSEIKEQTAIGNFFQKLDEKIEAESAKLEKLQAMKKAMLQRMFV